MDISDIETEFGFNFPLPHREDLQDLSSPIHDACDFLIPDGLGSLDFAKVNRLLRSESHQGWVDRYVAFASNGCGDYYAYDTFTRPYSVIYVDPMDLVADSSVSAKHYDEWREEQLQLASEVDEGFD